MFIELYIAIFICMYPCICLYFYMYIFLEITKAFLPRSISTLFNLMFSVVVRVFLHQFFFSVTLHYSLYVLQFVKVLICRSLFISFFSVNELCYVQGWHEKNSTPSQKKAYLIKPISSVLFWVLLLILIFQSLASNFLMLKF